MKEKNNLDNTSRVLGRLPLGPSEAKDITGTIKELTKVDPHEQKLLYDPFAFFDDVTGQTLDTKMAVEARKLEMQYFSHLLIGGGCPPLQYRVLVCDRWCCVGKRNRATTGREMTH